MLAAICCAVTIFLITLQLTKVKATDDQCSEYRFKAPFYPGDSCQRIYDINPESHEWSGYYWIINSSGPSQVYCGMTYNGSSCEEIYNNSPETGEHSGYYRINDIQFTYCNMTAIAAAAADIILTCAGMGGGWRRIVNIDISVGDDCPSGWRKASYSGISFCRVDSDDNAIQVCSSASFSTNGTSYQNVCGIARGYQKGITTAFYYSTIPSSSIGSPYVTGLSITYGNPRQHIWTYAAGRYDYLTQNNSETRFICPCAYGGGQNGPLSPSFVGTNYYCESGTDNRVDQNEYYLTDVLWDGTGCMNSTCCDNSKQPWFFSQLNVITSDNIEARICSAGSFTIQSTLIDRLEIYIQ